jgi:hypothetical protein
METPTESPTTTIHGIPAGAASVFVDRGGASHRFVAAGPYLRCLDHSGRQERRSVGDALEALSQSRTCERLRTAWQRHMLADDAAAMKQLEALPALLLAYLADQTRRHADRLDEALGDGPVNERARRRWHDSGWRAAPALAARYQAAGVESSLAFLALRRHVEPEDVPATLKDKSSDLARSTRAGGLQQTELLDIAFRSMVTDDFPYEPLGG